MEICYKHYDIRMFVSDATEEWSNKSSYFKNAELSASCGFCLSYHMGGKFR